MSQTVITKFKYTQAVPLSILEHSEKTYQYQTDIEQEYFQSHIEYAQQEFLDSMRGIQGTALVIGPGHCRDIPVPEFFDAFQDITLWDADTIVEQIVDEQTPKLNQQITIWKEDFTRVTGPICEEVLKNTEKPRLAKALDIASVLKRWSESEIPDNFPDTQYDFIAATVVLSQCNCFIVEALNTVLPAKDKFEMVKYGDPTEQRAIMQLEHALRVLTLHLQTQLLEWMASRLKPDGKLFLSTTPILTERKIAPNTPPSKPRKILLIDIPKVEPTIQVLFNQPKPHKTWHWTASQATKEMNWIERIFTVQTRTLHKK